jgi:arabinogalactan endo-1,4-beta-galactosidase
MARRAHAAGLRLLVDLHYADTWADPGQQPTPAAWRGLAFDALSDSVHAWTGAVVVALVAQGTPPDAVQIGNEIDSGMLWDAGHVGGAFENATQWSHLTALLAAGARAVREAAPAARVVVHVSGGGNMDLCRWFFDHLRTARTDYDVIGVSFYPWWHGSITDLEDNLTLLATRYNKDVAVVETAYPWTNDNLDAQPNLYGIEQRDRLEPRFGPSPQGQAAFARAVRLAVAEVPYGHGVGVWWWEPDWITTPSAASPWENCALFDSTGAMLPAARAFVH